MGFLDRLLGREQGERRPTGPPPTVVTQPPPAPPAQAVSEDERAVARYRYLLRTAPPEELERVHAEAFSRLTPEQRAQVLAELSRGLPPGERPPTDDPASMARSATRAELRQPGYLEQSFSRGRFGGAGGMGMGGTIVGSMMGTIAGVVIGSAIADALFDGYDQSPEAAQAGDAATAADGSDPSGDAGTADTPDTLQDAGVADASYAQDGSYTADGGDYSGGDYSGGDFGGGDFGGGDFGSGF